jgi:hypothetical protein
MFKKFIKPNPIFDWFLLPCLVYLLFWILIRAQYLDMAFYWDEAWVYVPGIRHMADAGPSLLPDAIPEYYSRGHPLLFYFLGSIWIKIFGTSYIAFHSFPLFISTILLLVTFFTVKEWTNGLIGLVVIVLLSVERNFFNEAGNVLPEIMIALFFVLSVRYFLKERYFLYFIYASLGILTKESGIVIPIALLLLNFLSLSITSPTNLLTKVEIRKKILILSPLSVFLLFMLIQYAYKGWFLFPEHTNMMLKKSAEFVHKFNVIFYWLFEEGKMYWFGGVFVFLIVLGNKTLENINLYIAIVGLLTGFYILKQFSYDIEFLALLAFASILGAVKIIGGHLFKNEEKKLKNILFANFIVGFLYLIFNTLSALTARYLIALLPFGFFLYTMAIKKLSQNRAIFLLVVTFLYVITLLSNFEKGQTGNIANQENFVKTRQELVGFLEKRNLFDKSIGINEFVIFRILADNYAGFLSSDKVFSNLSLDTNETKEIIIVSNVGQYPDIIKSGMYQLLQKFEKDQNWIEVWQKK